MFYALSWFFVVALLARWSLAAWALHAVAVWGLHLLSALWSRRGGGSGPQPRQPVSA